MKRRWRAAGLDITVYAEDDEEKRKNRKLDIRYTGGGGGKLNFH